MTITFSKFAYSLIILLVLSLFGSELYRIWGDSKLYIRPFGKSEDATAQKFAESIVHTYTELQHKFTTADNPRSANGKNLEPWEKRFRSSLRPEIDAPIKNSSSVLSEITLSIQDVNVMDILQKLRRWVGPQREITGTLIEQNSKFSATISIPVKRNSWRPRTKTPRTSLHFSNYATEAELAFDISCSIIWHEAALNQKQIARVPREEFCFWTKRWSDFRDLYVRAERTAINKSNEEALKAHIKEIQDIETALTSRIDNGVTYARFYELRSRVKEYKKDWAPSADAADLLTDLSRDKIQFEARHLLHLPRQISFGDIQKLPAFNKILTARRPAIPITDSGLDYSVLTEIDEFFAVSKSIEVPRKNQGYASDWKENLEPMADKLTAASQAVGIFYFDPANPSNEDHLWPSHPGVGFAISENLVVTARFAVPSRILNQAIETPAYLALDSSIEANFIRTDKIPTTDSKPEENSVKSRHKIVGIFLLTIEDNSFAILKLENNEVVVILKSHL